MWSRVRGSTTRMKVTVIAAFLLALALAPTSLAGTGVGAVFNLGQTNSVNVPTTLTGTVDSRMLQVTNTNTGTGAGGISVVNSSTTAPSVRARNTGGGPALALFTPNNTPPIVTNSTGLVANLNADRLDGKSSTDFLRSSTFRAESPVDIGTALGDGTFTKLLFCPAGSRLLSGGPANLSGTSVMVESFPDGSGGWKARIHPNGLTDNWSVVVLCASVN